MLSLVVLLLGAGLVLAIMVFALSGPSASRAQSRRVAALRARHGGTTVVASGPFL